MDGSRNLWAFDRATSKMIKYDLTTGRLDGGGGGGRVSMRILPKTTKPAGDN